MRDFSKISPAVWQSKRYNTLPSDDGRYLYLYLLTCKHQTSAGAYHLSDGYAIDDLHWTLDRYRKARKELVAADLIAFDDDESVVMITRWFKHNPPMNEKHLIGIERTIERLPSPMIAELASIAVSNAWAEVEAAKVEAMRRKAKASPAPSQGISTQ